MTTSTKPDLAALLERVGNATEPDRELDGDIAVAAFGGEIIWIQGNYTMEPHPARRHSSEMHVGGFAKEHVPRYTESLDAALSLFHEKLPGWECELVIAPSAASLCVAKKTDSPPVAMKKRPRPPSPF